LSAEELEKRTTKLRYHTASQLGQLLRELRALRRQQARTRHGWR
jgi:hypothetical protein